MQTQFSLEAQTVLMVFESVLSPEELPDIRRRFEALKFIEGSHTAGWINKNIKNNLEADQQGPGYAPLNNAIVAAIMRNKTFRLAARPKKFSPLLFSRYRNEMEYGAHVDEAIMSQDFRADISFTLALSDPSSYVGGELVIESTVGDQSFKLPTGHMIMYPSGTLHRVLPVTTGERQVAIGWIQSLARQPHHREMLYDLDTSRRSLFERTGKSREFDLVTKTLVNLQREWCEV